jgi:hypothetical protein
MSFSSTYLFIPSFYPCIIFLEQSEGKFVSGSACCSGVELGLESDIL